MKTLKSLALALATAAAGCAAGPEPRFDPARIIEESVRDRYGPARPAAQHAGGGVPAEWRTGRPGLDALLSMLADRNPEIRSARAACAAAEIAAGTGSAWDDPVFEASATAIAGRKIAWGGVASLTQNIPLGGRVGAASDLLREKAAAARLSLQAAETRAAAALRSAWARASLAKMEAGIARQNHEWACKGTELARRIAIAGGASAVDVHLLWTEERAARLSLLEAEDSLAADVAEIAGLLNLGPESAPAFPAMKGGLPSAGKAADAEIRQAVIASSPRLAEAGAACRIAQARVALEKAKRFPGFDLGIEAETEPGTGEVFVGVPLSFPIPLWNANSEGVAEALGEYSAAAAAFRAEADSVLASADAALAAAGRLDRRLRILEDEMLPAHRTAIALGREAMETSDFDPLRYVELERALRILERERCALMREILDTRAELETLAGRPLFPLPGQEEAGEEGR